MALSLKLVFQVSRHFAPSPGSGSRGGRISLLVASDQCEKLEKILLQRGSAAAFGALPLLELCAAAAASNVQIQPKRRKGTRSLQLAACPAHHLFCLLINAFLVLTTGYNRYGAPAPQTSSFLFFLSLHPKSSSLVSSSLAPVPCRPPIGPSAPA